MELLLGKPVSEKLKNELKVKVLNKKRKPFLQILLNNKDDSSIGYTNMICKVANEIGIEVEIKRVNAPEEYVEFIDVINKDKNIDACLITRPLVKGSDENQIFSLLNPKKDADAVNYQSLGRILTGDERFVPNTSLAIIKLLEFYNIELTGKKVLVIGRSLSVGKPVSLLLLNRNATVTVAHSRTNCLSEELKNYDIIIAALGKPHFIDGSLAKEGAIIIDAGIHYLESGIVGDVKPSDKLSYISKVPGGVGIITTSCLMETVVSCYEENTNDL